jgi:hypothetical protein
MNTARIFAIEFFLCIGITSWGAIKEGYAPWPPNIIGTALAMIILSFTSAIDERLSTLLAAGFLLALIVNTAAGDSGSQTLAQTFAALPQNVGYDVLSLSAQSGSSQSGTQPSSQDN